MGKLGVIVKTMNRMPLKFVGVKKQKQNKNKKGKNATTKS